MIIFSKKINDEIKIIRQQPKTQQNEFVALNSLQLSDTISLSNNKNSKKNQEFFISECSINSISIQNDSNSDYLNKVSFIIIFNNLNLKKCNN